jgi:hypothetical protein
MRGMVAVVWLLFVLVPRVVAPGVSGWTSRAGCPDAGNEIGTVAGLQRCNGGDGFGGRPDAPAM